MSGCVLHPCCIHAPSCNARNSCNVEENDRHDKTEHDLFDKRYGMKIQESFVMNSSSHSWAGFVSQHTEP